MSSIALVMLVSSLAVALAGVPLWLGKVPPNRFYGFRTPRTVNDAEVWYPVNQMTGLDLTVAGAVASVAVVLADLFTANPVTGAPWLVAAATVPILLGVMRSFWRASAWLAEHDGHADEAADEQRSAAERARRAARRETE